MLLSTMSKLPKPEKEEEADLRSTSMSQVLEALQGGAVFTKTLHPTHVPRQNHTCNGLSLPRLFVEENMERIRRAVVLLTRKAWPLRLSVVHWERGFPDVLFCGGWKAFAASNNLAEGDQLVFHLSAPSQFHVYIFYADGSPKPEAGTSPVRKLPECKHEEHVEERKPSVSGYFAREEIIQEILGEDLEERKPGHSIIKEEILELTEEEEDRKRNNIDEFSCNKDRRRRAPRKQHRHLHKQLRHPSFSKRLTPTNFKDNVLEIPGLFNKTYGNRLQSPVKLQGVSEASAVYTLACRKKLTPSRPSQPRRVFLYGCGWKEFRDENMLEVQQELQFSLVSDSYFVVRELCPSTSLRHSR